MAGSGVLMVFSFDGGGCYGFGRKDFFFFAKKKNLIIDNDF